MSLDSTPVFVLVLCWSAVFLFVAGALARAVAGDLLHQRRMDRVRREAEREIDAYARREIAQRLRENREAREAADAEDRIIEQFERWAQMVAPSNIPAEERLA